MGILDQVRKAAGRAIGRNIASGSTHSQVLYDSDFAVSVNKLGGTVSSGSQREEKIGRIVKKFGKFAVSSAVDESLKSEGLKAGPSQSDYDKNPRRLEVMVEEMQAKIETMEEEMNNATQLQSSTRCVKPSDNLKELLAEPTDKLTPLKADRKKVFIRSRL